METSKNIMVSVSCLVYNHEPYLRQCFDGFVMQKTIFPIEILVHDDASTDHSADIIREYTEKYPDLFKPIYQKENQYSKGVKITMTYQIPRAKGKYIAVCEGDDYWTDPLKLQKQVDFMEAHTDFALCFHNVKIWKQREGELVGDFITGDVPSETDAYYLAEHGNYIHTPSVVCRNDRRVVDALIRLGRVAAGDYSMWIFSAQYGKIKKFDECMAVYRYGSGIWSEKEIYVRIAESISLYERMSMVIDDENLKSILVQQAKIAKTSMCQLCERQDARIKNLENSHAFRLGSFLLKPVYLLKRIFKKK